MRRRRGLTSVARSVLSRRSQRNFSKNSAARTKSAAATYNTLSATNDRRYVRYTRETRYTGGRYQVASRRNGNVAAGRFVGMAH